MSEHGDKPQYRVDPARLGELIRGIEVDAERLVETHELNGLIEGLPQDRADRITEAFVNFTQDLAGAILKATLPLILEEIYAKALEAKVSRLLETNFSDIVPSFLETAGMTVEAVALIQQLASRTKDSREDVLRKALNLYQLLLDAQGEGNRMAILSPDDTIVHEVVGHELPETADFQIAGSGSPGR